HGALDEVIGERAEIRGSAEQRDTSPPRAFGPRGFVTDHLPRECRCLLPCPRGHTAERERFWIFGSPELRPPGRVNMRERIRMVRRVHLLGVTIHSAGL